MPCARWPRADLGRQRNAGGGCRPRTPAAQPCDASGKAEDRQAHGQRSAAALRRDRHGRGPGRSGAFPDQWRTTARSAGYSPGATCKPRRPGPSSSPAVPREAPTPSERPDRIPRPTARSPASPPCFQASALTLAAKLVTVRPDGAGRKRPRVAGSVE